MRPLAVLAVAFALTLAACGGDDGAPLPTGAQPNIAPGFTPGSFPFSTPEPATPRAGVPTGILLQGGNAVPVLGADDAVYLSIGDSINYGCCADPQLSSHPLFAQYLSERLNRPVIWVTLAWNDTLDQFVNGFDGQPPQLDHIIAVLSQFRREGRDVVAITLSIGGNDLLALRTELGCTGGGRYECTQAFEEVLERLRQQMETVFQQILKAKDPHTPIIQNNYYDALDCGRPGDAQSASALTVQVLNAEIEGLARTHGVFIADFYTPFGGHACDYISGVDPTYRGYDAILAAHMEAYEALPSEYVEPFVEAN